MIFNSISKELTNSQIRRAEYRPANYQPSSFQSMHSSGLRNSRNFNRDYDVAEKESALSQMNQKIVNNLQYLRYKDHVRQSELKGSRVSNRSNKSHHSNHSVHSVRSSSRGVTHTLSRYSIKTQENEHYFPNRQAIKPEFVQRKRPIVKHQHYQAPETNYKEFLRKPITIEEYNNKYGLHIIQNKRPQNDRQAFKGQTQSQSLRSPLNMNNFKLFKAEEGFVEPMEARGEEKFSATTPVNREWISSFGDRFPREEVKQNKIRMIPEQSSPARNEQVKENRKNSQADVLSPLEPLPQKRRDGLIVAIALVSLGLILFVLQVIK